MPEAPPTPWLADAVVQRLRILADSFQRLLGRPLVSHAPTDDRALAQALYEAPAVIVSHGIESDPVFWFANRTAQRLWQVDWPEFIRMPSRQSGEPGEHDDRERLLARARVQGFVDDYQGVRISASGRRFRIRDVVLWNLGGAAGPIIGQAATFTQWQDL